MELVLLCCASETKEKSVAAWKCNLLSPVNSEGSTMSRKETVRVLVSASLRLRSCVAIEPHDQLSLQRRLCFVVAAQLVGVANGVPHAAQNRAWRSARAVPQLEQNRATATATATVPLAPLLDKTTREVAAVDSG